MNYFTKEWYELCQKMYHHLPLEEDKKAESFSEEYFQQLYNEKLTEEFLTSEEEVASMLYKSFDREKVSQEFYKRFVYNQKYIIKSLPEKILKEIADIRVFALDKASHQVINAVTRFCEDNQKSVNRAIKGYQKYYEKALKSFDKNIVKNINFHDCKIIDIKQAGQSLSILFDNSGGFTDVCEIQFQNYNIIKQDTSLQNSWWLYDEIYNTNGKYELQVLLAHENGNLVEFIISAEHIFFKHNQEK